MRNKDVRVDFFSKEGIVEIRYFDVPKDNSYYGWKLPKAITCELAAWQLKLKRKKALTFPLNYKTKICEFAMNTNKCVDIREFDYFGRCKTIGWSLPAAVLEKLIDFDKLTGKSLPLLRQV